MASVTMKQHCSTVGELRDALLDYDADTPLCVGFDSICTVYLATPDDNEIPEGPWLEICGGDPWGEDDDE